MRHKAKHRAKASSPREKRITYVSLILNHLPNTTLFKANNA